MNTLKNLEEVECEQPLLKSVDLLNKNLQEAIMKQTESYTKTTRRLYLCVRDRGKYPVKPHNEWIIV